MYIVLAPGARPRLEDRDNFRDFKLVAETSRDGFDSVASVAPDLVTFDSPDQAWIVGGALGQLANADATWQHEFEKMVAYAETRGWIRRDPLRIAAHVEWRA